MWELTAPCLTAWLPVNELWCRVKDLHLHGTSRLLYRQLSPLMLRPGVSVLAVLGGLQVGSLVGIP